MLIIRLIKKYIFAIASLRRPVFEDALLVDTVLGAEPLPEDGAHCNAWSDPVSIVKQSCCYCAYFGCRIGRSVPSQFREA